MRSINRHFIILAGLTWLLVVLACSPRPPDPLPEPVGSQALNRGRNLVKGLAACGFCHGENNSPQAPLSGGRNWYDQYGPVAAANITNSTSGLKYWDTQEIVQALKASINPKERWLSSEVHAGYSWLSTGDTLAIVGYLRTLPGVENSVPRRDLSFIDRNTKGFFDTRREARGFVPEIDPRFGLQYGEYLVDHVARCTMCHNGPSGLLTNEEYLVGGKTIRTDKEEKMAPAINASTIYGIGGWSDVDIVNYLQTGQSPDGRESDSDFCPINYYRLAPKSDLEAMANYLKSLTE